MTCCKSTSTGVGEPTGAPLSGQPDIYIEQPSGQVWVWNGTKWVKPPIGAVYYDAETRRLTVGSSSVVLPIASYTEYGVVKLSNPKDNPTNPIVVLPDGSLGIDCAKLLVHCGLATDAEVDQKITTAMGNLSGTTVVSLLTGMTKEQLATLACKMSSNAEGNLLQCREDGLYYGIKAPANLQNQYIDAINGVDAEDRGTYEAPLKTIRYAVERLPVGTVGNSIYLKEGMTHYFDNTNGDIQFDKSVQVNRYGPISNSIEAAWNSGATGWTCSAAQESKASEPVVIVLPNYKLPAWPDKYLPVMGHLIHGHKVTFQGIKLSVDFQGKPSVAIDNWPWASMFYGDGRVRLIECTIKNAGANGAWHFINSHDSAASVHYHNCTLESTAPADYVTGVYPSIEAVIEVRDNPGAVHKSGLHWSPLTPALDIKNSQRGALAAQTVIPNYKTNI